MGIKAFPRDPVFEKVSDYSGGGTLTQDQMHSVLCQLAEKAGLHIVYSNLHPSSGSHPVHTVLTNEEFEALDAAYYRHSLSKK